MIEKDCTNNECEEYMDKMKQKAKDKEFFKRVNQTAY